MHTKLVEHPAGVAHRRARPGRRPAARPTGGRAEFGIPWKYLAAINLVETGIGRIRGTSIAGAQGPMQFMPATWEAYGGGRRHQRHPRRHPRRRPLPRRQQRRHRHRNALYRYNHSDHYVRGVQLYAELIARAPPGLPRLPLLGRLVPHRPGRGVPPGGLRAGQRHPGTPRATRVNHDPRQDEVRNLLGVVLRADRRRRLRRGGRAVRARRARRRAPATSWRAAPRRSRPSTRPAPCSTTARPRTKHLVTNTVLDIDEERRHARPARSSYLVLQQVGAGAAAADHHRPLPRHLRARTTARWRFAERRFFVDLVGDLRQHLAYEIG